MDFLGVGVQAEPFLGVVSAQVADYGGVCLDIDRGGPVDAFVVVDGEDGEFVGDGVKGFFGAVVAVAKVRVGGGHWDDVEGGGERLGRDGTKEVLLGGLYIEGGYSIGA